MKNFFKKHHTVYEDPVETKFDMMMKLIKDLPKKDYERLKKAMDLGYDAYQNVRNVKTEEEKAIEKIMKENSDIDLLEKSMEIEKND